jgi:hypothetical protein
LSIARISTTRVAKCTPAKPCSALGPGWNVDTVIFEEGRMLDIGTPDGLEQVLALPG